MLLHAKRSVPQSAKARSPRIEVDKRVMKGNTDHKIAVKAMQPKVIARIGIMSPIGRMNARPVA